MPLVTELPSVQVHDLEVVVRGGIARMGQLRQEFYYEIEDPEPFLRELRTQGPKMDIFTFLDRFPQPTHVQPYQMEWDNVAALAITSYDQWYKASIPKATRRGLRKAEDAGVEVCEEELNGSFVQHVTNLFNECPVRQGRPFWHYGKTVDEVREILSRDIERSRFLVAYADSEFIGFIKLLSGRNYARTTLIMSKVARRNIYPNNALIARAVRLCAAEKIPYLVYGQFEYGKLGSKTLADFKTNNGFQKLPLARYFVPMTTRGHWCLRASLHHGLIGWVPESLVQHARNVRARMYSRRLSENSLVQ